METTNTVKVSVHLSRKEYVRSFFMLVFVRPLTLLALLLFATCVILLYSVFIFRLTIFILLLLFPIAAWWQARRIYNKNPILNTAQQCTFSEAGVKITNETFTVELPWTDITAITIKHRFLYLWIGRQVLFQVPLNLLRVEDMNALHAMLVHNPVLQKSITDHMAQS